MSQVLECPNCEHEIDPGALFPKCLVKDCKCKCAEFCRWRSLLDERKDREPTMNW